jgi:hypothetical protein
VHACSSEIGVVTSSGTIGTPRDKHFEVVPGGTMLDRIINWFSVEPAVSVLMIATAIVLFGSAFRLSGNSRGFLPWNDG